jgi:hypothetical protein
MSQTELFRTGYNGSLCSESDDTSDPKTGNSFNS